MAYRSLAHDTTSLGGANVRDDMHITVFADQYPGENLEEDFNFEGHLYVNLDENGTPRRLLHSQESEFGDGQAPVVLYDTASQNPYYYSLGDEYYAYYDNNTADYYDTNTAEHYDYYNNAENYGEETGQTEAGEGTSQSKAKRKRRPKKGKQK